MKKQTITPTRSITAEIEALLNKQIVMEGKSSAAYLSMASWCDTQGYDISAEFLYKHSEEERMHMLKLIKFVNDRGGQAIIPATAAPAKDYKTLQNVFKLLLDHETHVTSEINGVVDVCLKEKDYTTHNFMQWYVSEQIEEESLARTLNDKLKLVGNDNGALYMFDRDLAASIPAADSGATK